MKLVLTISGMLTFLHIWVKSLLKMTKTLLKINKKGINEEVFLVISKEFSKRASTYAGISVVRRRIVS